MEHMKKLPCALLIKLSGIDIMTSTVTKYQQLADSCKLLAIFFYEPEMDLWQQEDLLNQFSLLLQKASSAAFPFVQQMREASVVISEEQMQVDYAALFVGPFELLAAPYGSVYLDRNKRIMGDSTMAVLELYREAGLKVDVRDAPDHIAIELEFMHYLYSQDGGREQEISMVSLRNHFLTTCLMPWGHLFCQNIKNGTNNLFYINLADCLNVFIAEISERDSMVLQDHSLLPQDNATPLSV